MITKKMLSPLLIAAALAALPAWSADAPPPRLEKSHDRSAARGHRTAMNAMNPLGATSRVNPLLPSPG